MRLLLRGPAGPIELRETRELHDRHLFGQWRPRKRRIVLATNMGPTTGMSVLWHEWIHAVLWDSGLPVDDKTMEQVCDVMAMALTGARVTLPIERLGRRTRRAHGRLHPEA